MLDNHIEEKVKEEYLRGFELGYYKVFDKVFKDKRINIPIDYSGDIDDIIANEENATSLFITGVTDGGNKGFVLANTAKQMGIKDPSDPRLAKLFDPKRGGPARR